MEELFKKSLENSREESLKNSQDNSWIETREIPKGTSGGVRSGTRAGIKEENTERETSSIPSRSRKFS